jgi:hypothetical protein
MSNEDLVLRVAALKVISEFTAGKYDEARAEIAATMKRGDRSMARSPIDETKIAAVNMSDPKRTVKVTDLDALTEWLTEHYPAAIVSTYKVCGSDEQIRRILFEHAPDMLRKVSGIDPEQLAELKANSLAAGQAVGPGGEADMPGITVETPDAVVSCKPDYETAMPVIRDLMARELLSLDGTIRQALTTAEEPA